MLRRFRRSTTGEPASKTDDQDARLPVCLVVGLGNPGAAYGKHRHNVGYWAANRLAKRLGIEFTRRSGLVELGEGTVDGRTVVIAKPRTFMNDSGKAVQQALKVYNLKPEQMVVVCDELDMPAARLRVRAQGGHGGHNGMRSIVGAVQTQEFPRVRIGIGRPTLGGEPSWEPEVVAGHVLASPPPEERAALEAAAERAAEAIELILREGVGPAMDKYNSA